MNKQTVFAVLLVIGMLATAALMKEKEIIFPEIAALAIGAWVMQPSPWKGRSINLWLSPTLAAFTGMTLIKFLPYPTIFLIAAALVLVIIQLRLLNSYIFPAISAAILPIVVSANSWYYPISVCI